MWRFPLHRLALVLAVAVATGPVGAVLDDIRRPVEQVEDSGRSAMVGASSGIEQALMRFRVEIARVGGERHGGDSGADERSAALIAWSWQTPRIETSSSAGVQPDWTPDDLHRSTARRAPPPSLVFA